ncbi:MAG: HAD family hydrolase [Ruminococcus sp.]|nr:HAD family hydrolase [Ruminococcus sp.]
MKKLAIFDLDGTLFDTSDVNYYSYKEALLTYGVELDKKYFVEECNGRHYKEFLPIIMGTDEYLEPVHIRKKNAYANNLDKARVNKHLFSIIEKIKSDYYIAIVTTASKKNVLDILNYHNYLDLFDLIITQEDVLKPKPDPQGFLLAMEHYNMSPENTLIFEDSDIGIIAAQRSKATVFKIEKF